MRGSMAGTSISNASCCRPQGERCCSAQAFSGGVFLGLCPAWASPEPTPWVPEPQLLRKRRPDVEAREGTIAQVTMSI